MGLSSDLSLKPEYIVHILYNMKSPRKSKQLKKTKVLIPAN